MVEVLSPNRANDTTIFKQFVKENKFINDYFDENEFNQKFKESTYKCQSLVHFNCRSIAKNFEKLEDLLDSLNHKFKIIGLTETWLNDSIPENMFHLRNYDFIFNNRLNKRGGGTGLYIEQSLKYKKISELSLITESLESLFIELDNKCNKNTIIGVIYRPPGQSINLFLTEFDTLLNKINASSNNCFLMGDFNLDLLKLGSNTFIDRFAELLYSYSFYSVIESPTRIQSSSASLIDNIFTNYGNHMSCGILISDVSDHLPIFTILTSLHIPNSNEPSTCIKKRIINESNLHLFSSKLCGIQWNLDYQENVDQMYNSFIRTFLKLYDECFPIKSAHKKMQFKKQWITHDLLKLCHKRSRLYKKYLKNPTEIRHQKYKRYRNFVTSKLREAKREYYRHKFNEVKNNSKSTWNLINLLLNKKK